MEREERGMAEGKGKGRKGMGRWRGRGREGVREMEVDSPFERAAKNGSLESNASRIFVSV